MKKTFTIFSILLCSIAAMAQTQTNNENWGIKWSGYVKSDVFYDTRQTSAANGLREGHFFLLPDNIAYDADSNDINDHGTFHMLSIQSRLRADITGPDALKAKTSGAIETEFYGTNEADINSLRLRHAFIRLDWKKTALMVGQNWHPLFPAESFPLTLSFNTGVPFLPFSRNPQIRFIYKQGNSQFALSAYSQRDFSSPGPDGSSAKYLRNTGIPGLNVRYTGKFKEKFLVGASVDYKTLQPELKTTDNYITDVTVSSMAAACWFNYKTGKINTSIMATYAQNAADLMMIGGYAVHSVTDTAKSFKEYTVMNTASLWYDFNYTFKKWSPGIFVAYSKNMGCSDSISGAFYGRGNNIDALWRISPRLIYTENKTSFAAEVEITNADYGTPDSEGIVKNTHSVKNIRFQLSAIYKF